MKASISSLQIKPSAAIESTIHRSSESITSSNDTNLSEISGFRSASNITTESNSRSFSNSSLAFGIDGDSKKSLLPMRIVLLFPWLILLSQKASPLIFPKNQDPRRYWSRKGTFTRHLLLLTEISYPKNYVMIFMIRKRTGI